MSEVLSDAITFRRGHSYCAAQSGPMLVADLGQPPFVVTPDDLAAVRLPVLAILGLDSDPFLQSTPTVIAASVPSARLVELTDCGHVTYAEQPDAFAAAVRTFVHQVFHPEDSATTS